MPEHCGLVSGLFLCIFFMGVNSAETWQPSPQASASHVLKLYKKVKPRILVVVKFLQLISFFCRDENHLRKKTVQFKKKKKVVGFFFFFFWSSNHTLINSWCTVLLRVCISMLNVPVFVSSPLSLLSLCLLVIFGPWDVSCMKCAHLSML